MINFLFDIIIYGAILIVFLLFAGRMYFKFTDRILFKDLTEWNKRRKRKER